MSHGFKVDFSGWDVQPARAKLLRWTEGFFDDSVWVNDQKLLVWFCDEGHTPSGLRQLVHNNLTYWKCAKSKRRRCGWVSPLSADEFRTLTGRAPKPVHMANVRVVTELLGEILANVAEIGVNRTGVRKRIREEELECYAKGFKALRANAGNISRRAADAARQKISHLRAHLELLSQVRAVHPDVMFYLSDAWEKRTVQDEMDMFVKKGLIKPRKGATLYRKYEEKREADILQELEKVLADIVGGESTNV